MLKFNGSKLITMVEGGEEILWYSRPEHIPFALAGMYKPEAVFFGFCTIFIGFLVYIAHMNLNLLLSFGLIGFLGLYRFIYTFFYNFWAYKNTEYIITDKNIYISGGKNDFGYEVISFKSLTEDDISITREYVATIFRVGNIRLLNDALKEIKCVRDYRHVFNIIRNQIYITNGKQVQFETKLQEQTNKKLKLQEIIKGTRRVD